MSLATSNRDGGRTNEAGHLRSVSKAILGQVLTGLNVSQRAAGANMSVDVAIGDALIQRSDGTYGHPAWNDAVYNQVIAAADGSNSRRDIVVMYIDYGETPTTGVANNTNGVVKIKSVSGTAAGSPVDPSSATIQSSVGSGNPWIKLARVRLAAGATSVSNSVIDDLRELAVGIDNGGWTSVPNTEIAGWAYSSWVSGTRIGVITVPTDATTKYTVGARLRLYQSTGGTKYGIIVKVAATELTVFFPSGTTLNNEAILNPYFSREKVPFGFDPSPDLWTITSTLAANYVRASPVASTWYNAFSLAVGIGKWDLDYEATIWIVRGSAPMVWGFITLSTGAATNNDPEFGSMVYGAATELMATNKREKTVTVTSPQTFYLNVAVNQANNTQVAVYSSSGANAISIIRAKCAYL